MSEKLIGGLFIHWPSGVRGAQKQPARALPKTDLPAPSSMQAFESHLQETASQVEHIDKLVELLDLRLKRLKSAAMEGLGKRGGEVADSAEDGPLA